MLDIKCVLVGESQVGKSCLMILYTQGAFPTGYVPSVGSIHNLDVVVDQQYCTICLWDTASHQYQDRLRPLSYANSDVVLICFSVADRHSFENAKLRWHPEVIHNCPNTPIILVGTKTDIRDNAEDETATGTYISIEEGNSLAQELNAEKYIECSAKCEVGVKELFDDVIRVFLLHRQMEKKVKREKKCRLI